MYSRIKLAARSSRTEPEAVGVFLFEGVKQVPSGYQGVDEAVRASLSQAIQRPEFTAEAGQVHVLYPGQGPGRVFVCGLGEPARFGAAGLRKAAAAVGRAAWAARLRRLELHVLDGLSHRLSPEQAGEAVGDGLTRGQFDFDAFRGRAGQPGDPARSGSRLELSVRIDRELREGFERALTVGRAQATARELSAMPPNVAHPAYVVDQCRKLARRVGLTCRVIDADQAREMGMGGLTAVGMGGHQPPALVCLEWEGAAAAKRRGGGPTRAGAKKREHRRLPVEPVMLVGKTVTFDTGGYSLKPGGSMVGMKYDKCGGMAVIGAMEAVAALGLDLPVVGLIPTAENLVDEKAYRPDDILTLANGVTVEVANTDAEGRLILADALAYGCRRYRPRAVVDLATLTGGVVVALGDHCAGLICNEPGLRERVASAAEFTGEYVWPLPLWDAHRDKMRGTHADLANAADRQAQPLQAAAFLSHFVGDDAPTRMPTTPWAHLDIAGVARATEPTALHAKGPTGYGVRLLARLLERWQAE